MKANSGFILSAIILLAGAAYCGAQEASMPYYVGFRKCLECHSVDRVAGVCSLEVIPEHDHSFGALAKPEAEHIAALCGVTEAPQESRICLGCHATAADEGPRWTTESFNLADGVQCEACHGAGSLHVRAYDTKHPDPSSAAENYILSGDRDSCTHCHRKRESHRQVLRLGYRRPPEDALYKTPVNLATSPDGERLYVVCENSNSLAVIDLRAGKVVDEIAVGKRPNDVAVSPDGDTLYVTNRMSDSLSVINVASGRVVSEIAVGDEPHGVLTDAPGRYVYVLNTAQNSISVIDTRDLKEIKRLASGRGPWSLARSPDGQSMYITSVWPNLAPFREPSHSEVTVLDLKDGVVRTRATASEANMLEGIAYVPRSGPARLAGDVVLFTLMRTKNLVPITRLAQGWTLTHGLGILWLDSPRGGPDSPRGGPDSPRGGPDSPRGGPDSPRGGPDGRVDEVLLDEPFAAFSDPGDIAVSPNGRFALVSSGGTDQVAVVVIADLLSLVTSATDAERRDVLPNHLGMSSRFVRQRIPVGHNPRGIVFAPDGRFAFVANALSDSVTVIETKGFTVVDEILLGGPAEISETRWGERLFHSADNAFGQQFSCRSCHPDGHVNGLTFDIEPDGLGMDPVDNRTLRGILDTAPFKWTGTNPTLARQCGPRLAVFFTRLQPFTPSELAALTRYISMIERPPNRHHDPTGLTPSQRRGKVIFERTVANDGQPLPPERRCITCHNSPHKTAGTMADVGTTMWFDAPVDHDVVNIKDLSYDTERYGELGIYYFADTGTPMRSFDAPHLTNIYDSAPYLHNGAAATLEEIWTRYDVLGRHGQTRDLTRGQFNDLIAYLKAL